MLLLKHRRQYPPVKRNTYVVRIKFILRIKKQLHISLSYYSLFILRAYSKLILNSQSESFFYFDHVKVFSTIIAFTYIYIEQKLYKNSKNENKLHKVYY